MGIPQETPRINTNRCGRPVLSIEWLEATGFQPVRFSESVLIFLPGIWSHTPSGAPDSGEEDHALLVIRAHAILSQIPRRVGHEIPV